MKNFNLLSILIIVILTSSCNKKEKIMKEKYQSFLKEYEAKVRPLYKDAALTYFNATITGDENLYKKYEDISIKLNEIYANKEDFNKIKEIKESGIIKGGIDERIVKLLYDAYLGNQVDTHKLNEITKLQTIVEQKFNTFRAKIDGKEYTDNELEDILKKSKDSKKLEKAYLASKEVGALVADTVIKIVKLRNEVAKELGFKNYHDMSLILSEQDPEEIEKLFDELDSLTRGTYIKVKSEMDKILAQQLKINEAELMPWHYQNRFFQEAPAIYDIDLDEYYKNQDIVKLTKDYYESIGMDITDILEKSDLYEKPKKYQHAYCTDIDQEGDVRVVCNIKPNSNWMGTMLHEYGHAVYDKYIDRNLPWVLRNPAHIFTTEAIAMMFGRLNQNAQWMQDMMHINNNEKEKIKESTQKTLKLQQLVFSRWAQVMYRFEKSMYDNPEQDLNKLWWDLVEKYQMIKRPADRNKPDWASKIHIATSPCYYHNYQLGELLASQLNFYICKNILKTDDINNQSFVGKKEVGKYLIEKVFKPGQMYHWNDMIEKATGEKLTAKYYAEQFIN